jgi:hypothetical protein
MGTVYPSGTQILKIPTTTLHPDTSSPFNPSIINIPNEVNWNAIKALEYYGFHKTTFDAAQPPYPAGGSFVNAGTYKLSGQLQFTGTGMVAAASARTYKRTANLFAYANLSDWEPGVSFGSPVGNHSQVQFATAAKIVFDFDIPSNCVLKGFSVYVQADATHASLPGTMPRFLTYLVDSVAGTTAIMVDGSAIDASASNGAYKLLHEISVNLSIVYNFDASRHRVFMVFLGETGGGGAMGGLTIHLPIVKFERTQIGEEFGQLVP